LSSDLIPARSTLPDIVDIRRPGRISCRAADFDLRLIEVH
jgi:hypothetical protein